MRRAVLPLLIFAAILVAGLLAWMALASLPWGGGGREVVAQVRTVKPFKRIDIGGRADVTLVQGSAEGVVVEAPERQQAFLETEVSGETLSIRTRASGGPFFGLFGGRGTRTPKITITFRELESIELAGAARVDARRIDVPELRISAAGAAVLRVDELKARTLRISGAGAFKADLAGSVDEQVLSLSGAGKYSAAQLVSQEARVSVAGAAKILVNVEKRLRISLSGAGVVEYIGNPEVKQSISGAGKVRKRDATDLQPRSIGHIVASL